MSVSAASKRHLFLAFTTFSGDPARFADWYDNEHIPELLQAPGVLAVQRFEVAEVAAPAGSESLDWGHLAMYEFESDLTPFRDFVAAGIASGTTTMPDYVDQPPRTLFLQAAGPAYEGDRYDASDDLADRHLCFALATPAGGQTDTDWYDAGRLTELASVSGMFRAQRFVNADTPPLGPVAPEERRLALHELLDDMGSFGETLRSLSASGETDAPDFLTPPFQTLFMRPVSARVTPDATSD